MRLPTPPRATTRQRLAEANLNISDLVWENARLRSEVAWLRAEATVNRIDRKLEQAINNHLDALDWDALTSPERITAEDLRRQVGR